jgi:hypothetical protein
MPRALVCATWLGAGLLVAASIAGCGDPARDKVVDSLGPEADGVPKGPLHRAGQPCLACHDGSRGDVVEFSLAGTIYAYDSTSSPTSPALPSTIVQIIDANGSENDVASNCAGNFFIQRKDWDPAFPVWVRVYNGDSSAQMTSAVYRDGSCGSCHTDAIGPSSPGRVYVLSDPSVPLPPTSCP